MATNLFQCNYMSDFKKYVTNANMSYDKFYLKSVLNFKNGTSIIVNSTSLINKYFDVIMQYTTDYEMTDKELLKYQSQPRLFAHEKLGSIELWNLLLKINYMTTALDFTKKKIKIPMISNMTSVLNEILIRESHNVALNKKQLENI